ncbi:MAG: SprT-like domain-containing protein [Desulfobacterales bacterium]|nr:SprT-like domain-containing protein [Desulfobacterales bacterium]
MPSRRFATTVELDLVKSLLLGLRWEYAGALRKAPEVIRPRVATRPNIMLSDIGKLGLADPESWTIQLKSTFAATHRFDAVRDVFLHEVAHLWASVYPEGRRETSHGPTFRAMCERLGADPHATNQNSALFGPASRNLGDSADPQDQLRAKVYKLLALANSPYPEEARSAASKASELITRYNLSLIEEDRERTFISRFMCDPAKRHPRHINVISTILKRFFFVEIVWVPAWVVFQRCAGSVPEMSGQPRDIEFASYVFDFIQGTIRAQWDQARQQHGFSGREFRQFALGVASGFHAKLEDDRRALSERIQAERNSAAAAAYSKRTYVCTDLANVTDPTLSEYVKRRYGRIRSIGSPCRACKASYAIGKKIGESMVLHRGVEASPTSAGLMLPD